MDNNLRPRLIPVHVEVQLRPTATLRPADISRLVERGLKSSTAPIVVGPLIVPDELRAEVARIAVTDVEAWDPVALPDRARLLVHPYTLDDGEPGEECEEGNDIPSFSQWVLPSASFDGLWESLVYDSTIQRDLLQYAASAMLFADRRVSGTIIAWNRVVLLHGPPGTGKTSLCRALAQKLAIRLSHRYQSSELIEINAHSLFSKWFSESGKLVMKMFRTITEMVDDDSTLVCILIDEVESLTAARQAAMSGNEPSDAIRVVNAVLTQIDALKRYPNVFIFTTSNITGAIDLAFVDRADIKQYIGPPSTVARYEILRSCMCELQRVQLVQQTPALLPIDTLRKSDTCRSLLRSINLNCRRRRDEGQSSQQGNNMDDDNNNNMNDIDDDDDDNRDGVQIDNQFQYNQQQKSIQPAIPSDSDRVSVMLYKVAHLAHDVSGRSLRKLPLLAHSWFLQGGDCSLIEFLHAMESAVGRLKSDRSECSESSGGSKSSKH